MTDRNPLRTAVEDLLKLYPRGMQLNQICERLDATQDDVKRVLSHLRGKGLLRSTLPGKSSTAYFLHDPDKVIAEPNQINKMDGDYEPHIHNPPLPGRPKQNDHMKHGSRMGDWIHFRDGTKKHITET